MYFPFTYNLTLTHGVKLSIIYNAVALLVHVRIFSKYMPLLVFYIHVPYYLQYVAKHVCPRAFDCCSYIIYEHRTLADFHGMKTQPRVCFTPTMAHVQRPLPPAHRCPPPRAVTTYSREVPTTCLFGGG